MGRGGPVNVSCTSSATCCHAAQMSGSVASLYTLSNCSAHGLLVRVFGGHEGVWWDSKIFQEQRSSPLCEVLTVEVCESACPSPAKNKFNAEAPALKRKKKPVNMSQ